MGEFNFKKYLKEGKLLKENHLPIYPSDDYISDQNTGYLVDQIYDDMMYTEFESKEDVDKYIDSIIDGINKLRDDVKKSWDENGDELVKEKKSLKENSDDYITDQNAGYLIDQIADDMMYTEFDSKEDINKFLDSIIAGINKLRAEKIEQWEEENTEPDFMDPDFDPNLEEGRHGPGRRMDDEWEDEPRSYYRRGNSSYKRALMNPPTPSGNQDEEEFDEEDIEYTMGKDYNAQNQRVLRNMDESKFEKALKKASNKLKENEESRKAYLKGMKYDNEDVLKNDRIGKALKSSADRYFEKEKEDKNKSKIKEESMLSPGKLFTVYEYPTSPNDLDFLKYIDKNNIYATKVGDNKSNEMKFTGPLFSLINMLEEFFGYTESELDQLLQDGGIRLEKKS